MYCKKCGSVIGQETKFCTKCGALNEYYNPENTVKSKKKNILFSIVGIVIAVAVVIGCTQIFGAYNKDIRAAKQNMKNGNYEEAISYLEGAEDKNNKKLELYRLKIQAYANLPDRAGEIGMTYRDAVANCRNADDLIDDIIQAAQQYIIDGNSVSAMEALKVTYRESDNQEIYNSWIDIAKQASDNVLQIAYPLIENNDMKALGNEIMQEKYIDLMLNIPDDANLIYMLNQNSGNTGIGLGLYYVERSASHSTMSKSETAYDGENIEDKKVVGYGNIAIYYGDYENGKRVGNGKLVSVKNSTNYYIFDGTWVNDTPNGYGTVTTPFMDKAEVMSGNLVNGLWEGDVTMRSGSDSGYQFHFTNGIPTVYGYSDGNVILGKRTNAIRCYGVEAKDKTWGVIGYCEYDY